MALVIEIALGIVLGVVLLALLPVVFSVIGAMLGAMFTGVSNALDADKYKRTQRRISDGMLITIVLVVVGVFLACLIVTTNK